MKNNRAVIYARVSSTTDRQSTERQVLDLKILAKSKNMRIENIYEEKISGAKKNSERAVLTECLEYCFSEGIGTLLISELSRLGRNVDEVLKNVMLCKERGLNVYFQKENLSIFDSTGKEHPFLTIFIAILGTVAAMERENISYRLQSGKAQYIAKGGKVGRKTGYRKPKEEKAEQYSGVLKLLSKNYPVKMISKLEGVSVSTIQRLRRSFVCRCLLMERGVKSLSSYFFCDCVICCCLLYKNKMYRSSQTGT